MKENLGGFRSKFWGHWETFLRKANAKESGFQQAVWEKYFLQVMIHKSSSRQIVTCLWWQLQHRKPYIILKQMAACYVLVNGTLLLYFSSDNEFSTYPNLPYPISVNPCYYVSLVKVNSVFKKSLKMLIYALEVRHDSPSVTEGHWLYLDTLINS